MRKGKDTMTLKTDFFLACVIGCASFGISLGIIGIGFIVANTWNFIISSMFFLIPMTVMMILFRTFKSRSLSNTEKGYSY